MPSGKKAGSGHDDSGLGWSHARAHKKTYHGEVLPLRRPRNAVTKLAARARGRRETGLRDAEALAAAGGDGERAGGAIDWKVKDR